MLQSQIVIKMQLAQSQRYDKRFRINSKGNQDNSNLHQLQQ